MATDAPNSITRTIFYKRTTKGTFLYGEDPAGKTAPIFPNIYLPKHAFEGDQPEEMRIEIHVLKWAEPEPEDGTEGNPEVAEGE